MPELYERKNYTLPIKYLFNTYIREYDISKCNVNILLYKGIINKEEYTKIMNLSREYRQVHIGYILKDERIVYTKIVNINAYYESNRCFHDSVKSKYSKKYYVKGD